ncbi:MAG TPA: hypothetical protein VK083_22130 [Nocardia sp.]|uniref:hypothetical protein n=1 Tax=Nocardia sp. TaxID=1821 RepID=UPI002B4B33E8|nr:hypothetical protein [Nocardia sp.]HLS79488.1 hypothetical protein [Nocardia sp.]
MPSHRHDRARAHRAGGRITLGCGDDLRKRSAGVPTTRCVNGGKRRYFTRGDAELALSGVDHDDPRRREQRCYRCPACHGWHLTSQSLAEYTAALSESTPGEGAGPATPAPARTPRTFAHITAGPAPSPADVAARARPRPAPEPRRAPAAPSGFGDRVRALLRRRLAHLTLPAALRRTHRP